jgi:DNA-binding phage protein
LVVITVTTLDTHETVKSLTAAGFTDGQAEALTHALRQTQNIDLSNLATKADLGREAADLRREMAEIKADMIKWVVGMGFAQVAMILAVLKLFPAGHP